MLPGRVTGDPSQDTTPGSQRPATSDSVGGGALRRLLVLIGLDIAASALALGALLAGGPLAVAWGALAVTLVCGALALAVTYGVVRAERRPAESPYDFMEKLGAGSMGEVWRVRHRRLGRLSAIKSIRPGEADAQDLARFAREARVTASLRSPHTVAVHDFGTRDDGSFFYAMELLDGIDLQQFVTRFGPMPPERVVHLLSQACHSLEEAHRAGLVHRDLKPANIMVCRYGCDVDFVKIVDFGLAKDSGAEGGALTAERTVLGTAAYLAPESLKGSKFVDGRADLYALGCIAFWLVTGRLLFQRSHAIEMAKAHVAEKPRRLSELAPDVPPGLDELVAQCLEKKPDARPQSAIELRRRLASIQLPNPWTEYRANQWWDLNLPGG